MKNSIYFEIQADDINRALNFYKTVFEWQLEKDENMPLDYWRIVTGGPNTGGLLKRPAAKPSNESGTNAYTCSWEVDDLDDFSEKILASGGQKVLPKFAVKNKCWQGYFLDTEGNVFGLYQVDENIE